MLRPFKTAEYSIDPPAPPLPPLEGGGAMFPAVRSIIPLPQRGRVAAMFPSALEMSVCVYAMYAMYAVYVILCTSGLFKGAQSASEVQKGRGCNRLIQFAPNMLTCLFSLVKFKCWTFQGKAVSWISALPCPTRHLDVVTNRILQKGGLGF